MLFLLASLGVLFASTEVVDLVDPIRLVILLLPERWKAPAAVLVSTVATTQLVAALVVARLPLAAREHRRWGWLVRALHWYSVVRLRDELGSTKLPGAEVGPRVAVAPVGRDTAPHPVAPAPHDRTAGGSLPGHASVGALVGCLVMAVAIAVVAHGCGPAREAALVAARAPDPTDCRPGAGRCLETPDGPIPVVCSYVETPQGTHREWPSLPRDPRDGRQRTCLHGCAVTDAGVPHCTGLPADGGAR